MLLWLLLWLLWLLLLLLLLLHGDLQDWLLGRREGRHWLHEVRGHVWLRLLLQQWRETCGAHDHPALGQHRANLRERERERARESVCERVRACACVCVCVCVRVCA